MQEENELIFQLWLVSALIFRNLSWKDAHFGVDWVQDFFSHIKQIVDILCFFKFIIPNMEDTTHLSLDLNYEISRNAQ